MTENAIILYYSPTQLSCRGRPHHLEAKHSELVMTPPNIINRKKMKKQELKFIHIFGLNPKYYQHFYLFIYLFTCNNRNIFALISFNEQVNCVLKSFGIQQKSGNVLEHDTCHWNQTISNKN